MKRRYFFSSKKVKRRRIVAIGTRQLRGQPWHVRGKKYYPNTNTIDIEFIWSVKF